VVYDVTALTQHETQVLEQERQLREILDFCPAAVCVVDEEGRILFHNRRMRDLIGYEKEGTASLRHQAILARP
jgi:PAS domain S-box-containing protein